MTITSGRQEENSMLAILVVAVIALTAYPAAILTCVLIYLFKKYRTPAVLPSLAVLLIYLTAVYINRNIAETLLLEYLSNIKQL